MFINETLNKSLKEAASCFTQRPLVLSQLSGAQTDCIAHHLFLIFSFSLTNKNEHSDSDNSADIGDV